MARNNRTVDRVQAIWNMIGGDDVVDQLIAGKTTLVVEKIRRLSNPVTITLPAVKGPKRLKDRHDVRLVDFANSIFGEEYKLPSVKRLTLERRDLNVNLGDPDIIDEIGGKNIAVNESVAILDLTIGQLIDRLNDVCSYPRVNIFYIFHPVDMEKPIEKRRVLCVGVVLLGGKFGVRCDLVSAKRWCIDNRVFSATVTQDTVL